MQLVFLRRKEKREKIKNKKVLESKPIYKTIVCATSSGRRCHELPNIVMDG
jgi:hypothetical protein